jgi:hypothetical protein
MARWSNGEAEQSIGRVEVGKAEQEWHGEEKQDLDSVMAYVR